MWGNYELASRTKTDSDECRSATLLTCISFETLDILDGLQFDSENDRRKVEKILDKLEADCIGETNETWERFNKRNQEHFESVDTYAATLRTLAKTCNYGTLEDSLIRDRMDPHLEKLETLVNTTLRMYIGVKSQTVGKCAVTVKNPSNEGECTIEFLITRDRGSPPILGAIAVQQMQLITVNFENIFQISGSGELARLDLTDIIHRYKDVLEGEGTLDGLLHFEVDETVTPVQLPCRKVPLALQQKLKAELERLTDLKIITPVNVPTDWISALVVVKKQGTDKIRICIDPKPLNQALKRNHYPIKTIDDILPELSNAKCFTLADAKNGFWHIQLEEESSFLTTFETPWGRYRWLRMPFGLSPAPEEF
ncbi:uncharacterized protein K02A2.6-like [Haliotis rubra]|uniref:uncharacterized protein K02A2.6-like n=1 Tax=Haliotis rubra TaxID=36100 RepID=UPI001EE62D44|nr:uncharacterized protein K02A2.6-like [Haliotis rubra]